MIEPMIFAKNKSIQQKCFDSEANKIFIVFLILYFIDTIHLLYWVFKKIKETAKPKPNRNEMNWTLKSNIWRMCGKPSAWPQVGHTLFLFLDGTWMGHNIHMYVWWLDKWVATWNGRRNILWLLGEWQSEVELINLTHPLVQKKKGEKQQLLWLWQCNNEIRKILTDSMIVDGEKVTWNGSGECRF